MGGQQSSTSSGGAGGATAKTCYYELLEVDQTASGDEIRKAYRRRALELHPDKNITDVENSTQRFAEVQTAYDILSDPQERAWYDSHRDAILQNQEVDDSGRDPSHFRNVRVTSAEDISSLVGRFNAAVPFTDEPTGFFGSLREIFDQLAAEETALGDHGDRGPMSYPAFGTSVSDYDDVVRPFYSGWAGFATRKTFSWKDKYRLPDAPDRRVRRLMEKENRKCRDDAIREFNDAVRFLVGFARKRDPRYLPNAQTDTDRQKALRSTVAAQAARSRAANQEKHLESIVADWVEAGRDEAVDDTSESEEEPHMEQIECVVCRKVFKSENQYQAHERSKKHIKAVEKLRREMRRENKDLDLEGNANQPVSVALQECVSPREPSSPMEPPDIPLQDEDNDSAQGLDPAVEASDGAQEQTNSTPKSQDGCTIPPASPSEPSPLSAQDSGADPGSNASGADPGSNASGAISSLTLEEKVASSKVGKAKARRAKKADRQASPGTATNPELACQVCNEGFTSRSKLFAHIREKKHAALREQVPHGTAKRSRRNGNG